VADEQVSEQIERMVAEEHDLLHKGEQGGLSDADHARLEEVRVELDRLWDLMRRRRALRSAGQDPDAATERDAETVERYLQ
jgi:Protein of unknown function (DUF2630)